MAWLSGLTGQGASRIRRGFLQVVLLLSATPALAQVQPCPADGDCVAVSGSPSSSSVLRGETFTVTINVQPGKEDERAGGIDDIAALTFSLAIPGLELADCSNPTSKGITPAVEVLVGAPVVAVVENTTCDDNIPARPCLCPGPGQTRAAYANLAIFVPKIEPSPEDGPTLPAGDLLRLTLRVRPEAVSPVTLHPLNQSDAGSKPPFGARASLGDVLGVDVSVADETSRVRSIDAQVTIEEPSTATPTVPPTVTATAVPSDTPQATSTSTATPEATATGVSTATSTPATGTPTSTAAPGTPTSTAAPGTPTSTAPPGTPTSTASPGTPTSTPAAGTPTSTIAAPTATATAVPPTSSPTPAIPTATETRTSAVPPTVTATPGDPTRTPTIAACIGDCNDDHKVSVEERRNGVRIGLGELALSSCTAADADADGMVRVDDLIRAVRDALGRCAP